MKLKKVLIITAAAFMLFGAGTEAFAEAPEGEPMTKKIVQTAGRDMLGKTAPDFARYNDDILFGEVWNKQDNLSVKQRSMITVVSLVSQGITDSSLKYHIQNAKNNGVPGRNGRYHHPGGFLRRLAQSLGCLPPGKGSV